MWRLQQRMTSAIATLVRFRDAGDLEGGIGGADIRIQARARRRQHVCRQRPAGEFRLRLFERLTIRGNPLGEALAGRAEVRPA